MINENSIYMLYCQCSAHYTHTHTHTQTNRRKEENLLHTPLSDFKTLLSIYLF